MARLLAKLPFVLLALGLWILVCPASLAKNDALKTLNQRIYKLFEEGKYQDAIWTLYPSAEFVEEIVNGNKDMSTARQAGENKGESKLLPGFQEGAKAGEIGALFKKI
jgi:hypothetical protein